MPWTDLLSPDRIARLAEPVGRDELMFTAACLIAGTSSIAARSIAAALQARETLGSTGIGRGIAIPHAHGVVLEQPRAAFLQLRHPLDFNARDGQPVDLVFAMYVPDTRPELHLETLAGIAERFSDPRYLQTVRNAGSSRQLVRTLLDPSQRDAA